MKKSKLTELLEALYVKHGDKNKNSLALYSEEIAQIVKEEIARVSKILKLKEDEQLDQAFNDAKPVDEKVDKSDLKNAKNRLKDPHTIEDIEYSKTRSGDKFVKIIYKKKYVAGKMMDTGPHFVSVFYNDEKDLQNIGKALKLKLKESVEEAAKRDYKKEYEKYGKSEKAKKYRAELNKYNRDKGTYGNGDGKDASHKGGKIVGFESESKNRGRAEKSRLKKSK